MQRIFKGEKMEKVKVKKEKLPIKTYGVGVPEKNPETCPGMKRNRLNTDRNETGQSRRNPTADQSA